jgi:ATP-binding cassette subfamily B (MDR/TAP) protein 1
MSSPAKSDPYEATPPVTYIDRDATSLSIAAEDLDPNAAKDKAGEAKDVKKEEPPKKVSMAELFKYADGVDKALMIVGGLAAFINGAGMPAFSEVFGRLINGLADKTANVEDEVAKVAAVMVYIGLIVLVLSAVQVVTWMIASERQMARIRQLYFDALLNQDAAFYDENKPGGLVARLEGDTRVVKVGINDKVTMGIMNLGMFGFGYGLGFYRSWKLTLVMMSTMPIIAALGVVMAAVLMAATQKSREDFAAAGEVSEEVLQSIRTVQLFGGEEREVARFKGNLDKAGAAGIKKEFSTSMSMGATYGVMFSSYALAFWFGGYLIRHGESDVGKVTAVFFSVLMGSFGLGFVFPTIGSLSESQGAAYKIYEVMRRKPTIDPRDGGLKLEKFHGKVEFRNVAFSYPTRKDTKLFVDLNLTIEAGETVAFSGASGCGKSSIIALAQRMYDADSGSVLIDGEDIRGLDVTWWRDQVGIVAQEPALFSGTVNDNIRVGKPDATDDEIREACRKANIHDTVMGLPEQYETSIGAVGSQLSGGQKQRLAIARAIIKKPKLLILDEATSALDRKSEAEVQAALDEIMKGGVDGRKLTVLVIAHRLTTIRNVDRIYFITHDDHAGSAVAEAGTYDELIAKGGPFAMMAAKQHVSSKVAEEQEQEDEELQRQETELAETAGSGLGKRQASGTPGVANTSFGTEARKKLTLKEQADEEEKHSNVAIFRLMQLSKEKTWAVILGLLGSVIAGGIYPAYAVVLSFMLEVLGTKTNDEIKDQTPFWAGMFVVIGVSVFIGWFLQGFYSIAGEHVTCKLRAMLFRSLLRQDMTFFDTPGRDVGSLGKVLEGDTEAVHLLWGPALGAKVQMTCNVMVGLIIALVFSWRIALVTLACIPVMIFAQAAQMMLMSGFANQTVDEKDGGVVTESLLNIRTVAAFNLAGRQSEMFRVKSAVDEARGIRVGFIAGIVFGFSQFAFYGVFALAFWYGGKLIQNGEATFRDVLIAAMSVLMGAMGAGEAGGFAAKSQDAAAASRRVFAMIDHVPTIDPNHQGSTDLGAGATLEFENVKFTYPARPKAVVLRQFTDRFANASTVGLIGTTGCGKSTIIQLLGRFYDPVSGAVNVNGHDLRSLDLRTWRSELSACLQEPSLFSGTILDNIKYSRPDATDDEVHEVAKLASIHTEVLAMQKGYETEVGYKGRMMSGGQKQRVAIARALLRRPRVLLLDEATSALDNATEANVMLGLEEYTRRSPMTIVSVAHRLTTIQNSDKIVLLDAGIVLEEGTHDELMAKDGHYAKRFQQYQAAMH